MTDDLIGRADKDTFALFVKEEYLIIENLDNDNNLIQIQMFIVILSSCCKETVNKYLGGRSHPAWWKCAEGGIS